MEVVGHDDEFIQLNAGKAQRQYLPVAVNGVSQVIRQQVLILHFTEEMLPAVGHQSDEIGAGVVIGIMGQTHRFPF
jgi:hypothetical protein